MVISDARFAFYRHVNALKYLCRRETLEADAARLVMAVLCIWQEKKFPCLRDGERHPYGSLKYMSAPQTVNFAHWLSNQEDFNTAAFWLASAYAIWMGNESRAEGSLYFTPPALAQRVIDNLIKEGASLLTGRWHDPACGGAAFLVPVAQRMAKSLREVGVSSNDIQTHIERHISGCDLNRTLLALSKQFLRMAFYDLFLETRRPANFELRLGNGLLTEPAQIPDIVICNPPYRKLKNSEVLPYRKDYAEVIEGQPNIYGLFIYNCLRLVSARGIVGLLTPTSFLSGESFTKLRTYLIEKNQPVCIGHVRGRRSTFIHVEQETAIMICKPGKEHAGSNKVKISSLSDDGGFDNVGFFDLPKMGLPWSIPKNKYDLGLLSAVFRSSWRLESYGYRARVGHLVHYRDKRRRFEAKPDDSKDVYPLIWATDIAQEGIFTHGRKRRDQRKELYVESGSQRFNGVVKQPSIVLQRVTSSDQRRRLICAAIPTDWIKKQQGFIAENHVIVIEQVDEDSLFNVDVLCKILQTSTLDRVFRSISGASNVSLFELSAMPMPCPAALGKALQIGVPIEAAVLLAYETSAVHEEDDKRVFS